MELGKSSKTILVVDDDCNVRMLVKALLESEGYAVLVAADAATAMQVYQEYESAVALLLTDVVMSNINGLELADRLLEREPHLRVLFMSGSGDASRGFGCVAKPFTGARLIGRVGEVLESPQQNFHFNDANSICMDIYLRRPARTVRRSAYLSPFHYGMRVTPPQSSYRLNSTSGRL